MAVNIKLLLLNNPLNFSVVVIAQLDLLPFGLVDVVLYLGFVKLVIGGVPFMEPKLLDEFFAVFRARYLYLEITIFLQ